MASGDQEEVFTLLLTDIDLASGVVDDGHERVVASSLKNFYHDHLLRSEVGKVISVDIDSKKASAIVKVKVKTAAAASFLEEVRGNLKTKCRSEKIEILYSETSTLTLNWNASMKNLAGGIVDYAKEHYPTVVIQDVEGVQTTISGTVHDILNLQYSYTKYAADNFIPARVPSHKNESLPVDNSAAVASEEANSNYVKKYDNLNPDVLALLQKMPEGKIDGVHYDPKHGCILLDDCSAEEETACVAKFQAKYEELTTSRKIRVDAVEIPQELSDLAVNEMISSFDAKYNQCVFVLQEDPRSVRVISCSSRQFEQAKKILNDNLNEALNKPSLAATSWTPTVCDDMTIPLGSGRMLTLKKADIVLEDVDIIVNAANGSLEHGGGVAGAIDRASNGAVQNHSRRYIRSHGKLSAGQVALTQAGGSLKCKHIIHAVGPTKSSNNLHMCEHLLCDVTKKVLVQAEKSKAHSISMPAISSGIFGVGTELVAQCITESIIGFKFRKPPPILSDIRIVIIDKSTHSCFAKYFATKMAAIAALSKPASTEPASSKPATFNAATSSALSKPAPSNASSSKPGTVPSKPPPPNAPPADAHKSLFQSNNAFPLTSAASTPCSSPVTNVTVAISTTSSTSLSSSTTTASPVVHSTSGGPLSLPDNTSGLPPSNLGLHSLTDASSGPSSLPTVTGKPPSISTAVGATAVMSLGDTAPTRLTPEVAFTYSLAVSSYATAVKATPKILDYTAERGPTPIAASDAFSNIAKLLITISDKWYMLGCALGFSTNQLDGLNAHSPDAPLADKMLEVLRVAHAHYGNTPTFVNALMTALQSPIVSAPHLASELAKGFGVGGCSAIATSSGTEKNHGPVDANDIVKIAEVLMPIADKWYMLGHALGFSANNLDSLKAGSPNAPNAMFEVLRATHRNSGDTQKCISALMCALRSPGVDAQHLASILPEKVFLARDTAEKSVSTGMLTSVKDAHVIRPLLRKLSKKWNTLGALLGFDNDTLKEIASSGGNVQAYMDRVVTKWLCGDSAHPPTLQILIAALKSPYINEKEITTKLMKAYNISPRSVAGVANKQPTIEEEIILPYLVIISGKWRLLGILLGVSPEDLVKLNGEPEECLRKVTYLWLSGRCFLPPTLESLSGVLRNVSVQEDSVADAIEEALLKKMSEEDCTVGGDVRGNHHPALPPSDDEGETGVDEASGGIRPPPGFNKEVVDTSGRPPFTRSMSDSHTSPPSSLASNLEGDRCGSHIAEKHLMATGADGCKSSGLATSPRSSSATNLCGGHNVNRTTDKPLLAAATDGRVKGKLAAAFNLKPDHGKEDKVKISNSASSEHKRDNRGHGKTVNDINPPETADKCVICLEDFKDPVMTKCKHIFCKECINRAAETSPYCPVCKVALRQIIGNQPPNGTMTYVIYNWSLPGYEGYDTIQITYNIPSGTQGQNHPNPGERYTGAIRQAYLPNSYEGQEVFLLLQKAFKARLTFTVGRSITTGAENTVVWNDIHHKTSSHGGPYGYPDPTYLQRVKADLAAKGIVPDDTAV